MPIERNMIRKLLNILAVVAVLAGCGTEVADMPEKVGYLAVDLSCDNDTQTKAEDVNPADFDIIISGPVNITSKCADLPEIIELTPGAYTVTVQSPEDEPAAFDQPIYGCSATFEIVEDATTSVKLICTLLNMKVTVNPSQAFMSQVQDFEVTVTNAYGQLSWTKADVARGKAGYFIVAPMTVSLRGVSVNGTPLSYDGFIFDVEASDHHIISFDSF